MLSCLVVSKIYSNSLLIWAPEVIPFAPISFLSIVSVHSPGKVPRVCKEKRVYRLPKTDQKNFWHWIVQQGYQILLVAFSFQTIYQNKQQCFSSWQFSAALGHGLGLCKMVIIPNLEQEYCLAGSNTTFHFCFIGCIVKLWADCAKWVMWDALCFTFLIFTGHMNFCKKEVKFVLN